MVYGFDEFHGVPYSHDMRPLELYDGVGDDLTTHEGKVDFSRLTQRFFQDALTFAEANQDRPFFVLLALTAPHIPLVANPDDVTDSPAGLYGDIVEEIDVNVGRLMARLEALGIADDTLVVFTSDNGPWFEGSSGPFRDRKGGSAWDGGFRVPSLWRWPNGLPAGRVESGLASNLDILPTVLGFAGAPPPDVELDGRDIGPMLRGEAPSPHEEILLFNNNHVAGLRTERWKLVARSYYRTYDAPLDQLPLLFDMAADPGENYSLAARHPDVLAEMRARIARAREVYEPIAQQFPKHVAPASAADHPD
jgi:arylsulfatase A-like enzyme